MANILDWLQQEYMDEDDAVAATSAIEVAQFEESTRKQHTIDPSFGDQFGAGIDLGVALGARGAQSIAEVTGMPAEWVEGFAATKEQALDAANRVDADQLFDENGDTNWGGFYDQLGRGAGTLAAALPAAAFALFGGKAAVGATLATSAVMNIGDIGLKAEELDASYIASLSDVAMGSALGVPEALIGTRFLGKFDDVAAAMGSSTMTRMGLNVAENAVTSGVTEGLQDAATQYIAHTTTNSWDEDSIQNLWRNAGEEALIGGILGAPVGVGSTFAENMANSEYNKFLDMFQAEDENGVRQFEADGITPIYDYQKTNWEAYRDEPGMLNKAYSMVLGGPTAKIMASEIGQSQKVAELVAEFSQTTGDWGRAQGIQTVGSVSNVNKGRMYQKATPFLKLNKKSQQAVHDAITSGDMTAIQDNQQQMDAYNGLREMWDAENGEVATKIREINEKLSADGRETMDDFHALGDDYFTNAGDVDVKKIRDSKEEFKSAALAAAQEAGVELSSQQVDAYVQLLDQNGYVHYGKQDNILHTIKQKQENLMANEGMTAADAMREASNLSTLRTSRQSRTNKNNPLEVERMLNQLPQEFWTDWRKGDLAGAVKGYIDMTSERLAHVEKFGVNNEIFTERVVDAMLDAEQQTFQGRPVVIKSKDWANFANLINSSQRIPTNRIQSEYKFMPLKAMGFSSEKGFTIREAQNAIRSVLNITLLPLSLIPSIPEIVVVAEKTGGNTLTNTGKILAGTLKNAFKGKQVTTVNDMVGHLGFGMHEALNTASARFADGTFSLTAMEGKFFNWTGTPQFTEGLRMTAATAAERMVLNDIKEYMDPTIAPRQKQRLAQKMLEIGLNPTTMENLYRASTVEGIFSMERAAQHPDFQKFVTSVHNFVEDTVIHPHPVQKPAWMNDERLQLLAQLKTYTVVFTNQVMRSWYNRMVGTGMSTGNIEAQMSIATTVAMMTAMQTFLSAGREFAKTGDIERWEDEDFIDHTLNGLAYVGGLSFAIDPFRSSSFGVDPSTVILGPGVSQGNEAIQGLAGVMGDILDGTIPADDVAIGIIQQAANNFPIISGLSKEL